MTGSNGEIPGGVSERDWRRFVREYRAACRSRADVPAATKLVVDEILDHFGANAAARPGMRRIAQRTGMKSLGTIVNSVKIAVRKGILVCDRAGPGVPWTYSIPPGVLETIPKCTDRRNTPESQERTDRRNTPQAKSVPIRAPKCSDPRSEVFRSARQSVPIAGTKPLRTYLNPAENLEATAAVAGRGGKKTEDVHAALESAGIGEPTLSQIAADPRLTIEAVRAATKLADSRRTNNRAGFVVSVLRDRPPELIRAIAAERVALKNAAAAQASAARLKLARESIAAASADAIKVGIESASDRIRSIHPTSRPRPEFERFQRSCSGSSNFAAVLPPDLACELAAALREPAEAIA